MKNILFIIVAACSLSLLSCKEEVEVKQDYKFSLSTWELSRNIPFNRDVEIRFYLDREGDFKDATYKFSYFQVEGQGHILDTKKRGLEPREMYDLKEISDFDGSDPYKQSFTVFFKPFAIGQAKLKFVVTDNFGKEAEVNVSFEVNMR